MKKVALAIAAHPDDIEFLMAGTLLLLKENGYEIHYMNLSTGNCGSTEHDADTTATIRLKEAQTSAAILGAEFHPPVCNDFEIFYNAELLLKISTVIRKIKPNIILTHSPVDYMEDHMNTSRLTTTAAFVRGVPNYNIENQAVGNYNCAIYHAVPHGLRGPLRERIIPEVFINTASVHSQKMEALRAHESQQNWLEDSQKMNSYLFTMETFSTEVGRMSGEFDYAEGWRQHLHLGFSEENYNPLQELGKVYLPNSQYQY